MGIEQNIAYILERIEKAANRAGRNKDEIILVAVSKTHPIESILKAKECGINIFGENKAQELIQKYPLIDDVKWHFIGHLQKNKVKYIIDKVDMIHSLDSIELAKEIDKRAEKNQIKMRVLIEINIGKEDSKSGIYEEEIYSFMEELTKYKNLIVSGIMTIPPLNIDSDKTREYFRRMRQIFDEIKNLKYDNFDIKYISMGMTDDFEIAIEEGANIIRIGTGIFGKRIYKREGE
ncbi:hypothetical protein ABG79_01545 [Caloramator mitchellensis]|uniref:Pyridoxal phosphate homeostasis protein n=1 Tax=Caloramator mitchellensis TaxID=908809 RepID=A0A0R3K114_CALMK|nr:YggS family pyridoxal phosphate-dependent enzyme [Caloramator mitchellensis]KRQ86562.1 hypothetical protein ABG79_01545 [Caloramator mitchellensis]